MKQKNIKKCILCVTLAVMIFVVAGCGNNGTKNHLKTGEERAVELKQDARDAVSEVNEDTDKINETVKDMEE